jgi:hypothetical protein
MKRETYTIKTSILKVNYWTHSVNGNPQFKIDTTDGTFGTEVDAQIGYAATNFEPRSTEEPRPVTLTMVRKLRGNDRIIGIIDREIEIPEDWAGMRAFGDRQVEDGK